MYKVIYSIEYKQYEATFGSEEAALDYADKMAYEHGATIKAIEEIESFEQEVK